MPYGDLYPDVNVYQRWLSQAMPASRILLSPCVIGPHIDVFESEAIPNATYIADPDATAQPYTWDLPKYNPQYHRPVDYSFLNECGRTWIEELEAAYIVDTVDNVVYDIDSNDYTIDYGTGIITFNPYIIYEIGDFLATVGEIYTNTINGSSAVTAVLESSDNTFPYFTVNGYTTRARSGDIIEIPYVFSDKYSADGIGETAFRSYAYSGGLPTSGSSGSTISLINTTTGVVTFTGGLATAVNAWNAASAGCTISIACRLGTTGVIYIIGKTNGANGLNDAYIGGNENLVRTLDVVTLPLNIQSWAITSVPTETIVDLVSTVEWNAAIVPVTVGNHAILENDLIHIFYCKTINVVGAVFANYTEENFVRYGNVTDPLTGNETQYVIRGTGGSVTVPDSSYSIVAITYASAWLLKTVSSPRFFRRRETGEEFLDNGGISVTPGHFVYIKLSNNTADYTNTNLVPTQMYGNGSKYKCSACYSGEMYLWGFLQDNIPGISIAPDIVDIEISILAQNPNSAYIPEYSGTYILSAGFYDITPINYPRGVITSSNNKELAFYMFTTDGVDALIPSEIMYEFSYNIYRPLNGIPKVTYMVFNNYLPSSPIEISTYSDITNNLGNVHPYNPLAYAAYLMYKNRTNNNRTIVFYAIPINEQGVGGYINAIDVLKKFKSSDTVLYELAALTFNDEVHTLIEGFVNERSTPLWSDYRRYWKAVCIPPSYMEKVKLSNYTIGTSSNILIDTNTDFENLNVAVNDYIETIPDTMYMTLANTNLLIPSGSSSFILTHASLSSSDSLVGKYLYFIDTLGKYYTGKITKKISSVSVLVELDETVSSGISETSVAVYIFSYWFKFRITEILNKHSVLVDANLPTNVLVYRCYTQYSKEDIAELWYTKAKEINSERIMIVNPWIRVTWEGDTYVLPGYFLASAKAAQAGAKANISEPMSGWPIAGIDYVEYGDEFFGPRLFQMIYLNGIDIHMNQSANGPVMSWRQRTTAQDINIFGKHEQSVVKVIDYLSHVFKKSIEPFTKKYNISQRMAEWINTALEVIMKNAKAGGDDTRSIIENNSRILMIKAIKTPKDFPADFVMDSQIPFEPGYFVRTLIIHKTPNYRIQHDLYVAETEEDIL